jgi:hypothetical protein
VPCPVCHILSDIRYMPCNVLSAMFCLPCPVCPTLSGPVLSWSAISCLPCPVCPILSGPVLSWSAYLSCLPAVPACQLVQYERTSYPSRISGCVASCKLKKIYFQFICKNEP